MAEQSNIDAPIAGTGSVIDRAAEGGTRNRMSRTSGALDLARVGSRLKDGILIGDRDEAEVEDAPPPRADLTQGRRLPPEPEAPTLAG